MKRVRSISVALLLALVGLGLIGTPGSLAAPPLLWQVPEVPASGSGAGELSNPRGIAIDPESGNVFVADNSNNRVVEFDAWGQFVKAFGWRVNAANPEEKLQVCTAETGCFAGSEGGNAGQLKRANGMAVDADGSVYVFDRENFRVQKFDSEGHFIWMVGGDVNKTKAEASAPTAERNRCPVDPGDVCKAGSLGTGDGQFLTQEVGDALADGPGGTLYVGDVGRIQKFDGEGNFLGEIKGAAEGHTVEALDVDETGNLYAIFSPPFFGGPSTLMKMNSAGAEVSPTFEMTSAKLALAVDRSGNIFVVDAASFSESKVREFDKAGNQLIPSKAEEEELKKAIEEELPAPPGFAEEKTFFIPGLALSGSACRASGEEDEDLYVSYFSGANGAKSMLRSYGQPPNPSLCQPPERAPAITEQYATSVSTDAATVGARVNSNFWSTTTYYVEYGTGKCSEGGCDKVQPLPPGSELGSETNAAVPTAGVFLADLDPGTTYHYRFVAQTHFEPGSGDTVVVRGVGGTVGADGEEATFSTPFLPPAPRTDCPNQGFRTAASAPLPDCRAYEMVSPVDKEGGDVVALKSILEAPASLNQSSTEGSRLTYSAYRAFAGAGAAPYTSQYMAARGASGWASEQISPRRGRAINSPAATSDTEFKVFSPDLCRSWMRLEFEPESVLDPAALKGFSNLYRREGCGASASYSSLTTVEPPNVKPSNFAPEMQGASEDGRCTVIRSQDALTPEAPYLGEEPKMQLYESCDGVLRLVSVLPSGLPSEVPSSAGASNFGESFVVNQLRHDNVLGATSVDGRSIYWTATRENAIGLDGPGSLYLRINADQPQSPVSAGKCIDLELACTLPVSEKAGKENATFWAASEDGTHALFTTEAGKLYEYDASNPTKAKATLLAEGVSGLLGASRDATRSYFASSKAIGGKGQAGEPNLYFLEAGQDPLFIGTLSKADVEGGLGRPSLLAAISIKPEIRVARVTPDGLHATFVSSSSQLAHSSAGYDNTDQKSGEADGEVYLYSAPTEGGEGKLICASCDPSGARPVGRNIANEQQPYWAAARIAPWQSSLNPSRVLAEDGSRLFFDSFSSLVGRDANGKADVYEWQPAASQGACEALGGERFSPASEGCLSLISSGENDLDSEFLDSSASGSDVFFATASSLLPQDPGLIDIYNARVDGGFPPPPSAAPACEGEACQGPSSPPDDPTPASSAFEGAGNVKAEQPKARCAKGRVSRKGRCVKQQAKKSKKAHKRRANRDRRSHR